MELNATIRHWNVTFSGNLPSYLWQTAPHPPPLPQWEQGRRSRFRPYPGEGVSVDSLLLQIKSLKAQLSEHKTFAHERIAALLEDRRVAEVDADAQAGALRAALDHALERQGGLQEALEATTRDYIKVRMRRGAGCVWKGWGGVSLT